MLAFGCAPLIPPNPEDTNNFPSNPSPVWDIFLPTFSKVIVVPCTIPWAAGPQIIPQDRDSSPVIGNIVPEGLVAAPGFDPEEYRGAWRGSVEGEEISLDDQILVLDRTVTRRVAVGRAVAARILTDPDQVARAIPSVDEVIVGDDVPLVVLGAARRACGVVPGAVLERIALATAPSRVQIDRSFLCLIPR